MDTSFNKKLGAMILLLVQGRGLTRAVMNRLLFAADVAHFRAQGRSISGATYLWFAEPVPAPIDDTRFALMHAGLLSECAKTKHGRRFGFRYTATDCVNFAAVRQELIDSELRAVEAAAKEATLSEELDGFKPRESPSSGDSLDFQKKLREARLVSWLQRNLSIIRLNGGRTTC